jgi:hypothetical protein
VRERLSWAFLLFALLFYFLWAKLAFSGGWPCDAYCCKQRRRRFLGRVNKVDCELHVVRYNVAARLPMLNGKSWRFSTMCCSDALHTPVVQSSYLIYLSGQSEQISDESDLLISLVRLLRYKRSGAALLLKLYSSGAMRTHRTRTDIVTSSSNGD